MENHFADHILNSFVEPAANNSNAINSVVGNAALPLNRTPRNQITAVFPIPRNEEAIRRLMTVVNAELDRQIVLRDAAETEEEYDWHETEYQISRAKMDLLQAAWNCIRRGGETAWYTLSPLEF